MAGSLYGQPLAYQDLVYVGSPDSQIFALDAATGEVRWRMAGQQNPAANAATLTIAQGLLFASGSRSSYVIAPQNGHVLGKFDSLVYGAADGMIYLAGPDGSSLQAWNPTTKRAAWTLRLPGTLFGPVTGGGGLLYSGLVNTAAAECCTRADQAREDWTGRVFAYFAATGRTVWSYPAPAAGFSAPLLTSGIVYIAGDFNVYALNAATGRPQWVTPSSEQLLTSTLEIGPTD